MKPRRLELDFVRAPRSAWRAGGWALLVAAAAASFALAEHHVGVAQRHAAVQAQQAEFLARLPVRRPRGGADPDEAQALADIRGANTIIDQLAVPWEDLFDAVEASHTAGLGLLSMAPTARDRSLRLAGEARSMTELLAYIKRLGEQSGLRHVHLQNYNTVQRDGASVLSFTLVATWKGQP
jgi:hypothetical protein